MGSKFKPGAFAMAALAVGLSVACQSARAQTADELGSVVAKHGAWSMVCGQPPGAPEKQCAIEQVDVAKDRAGISLSVIAFKTAGDKTPMLSVIVPLDVLLPKGLTLFVDNKKIGRAYFMVCRVNGCEVQVKIDDDLMKTLSDGKQAYFSIYNSKDADGIAVPVDLNGFGDGFKALP